MLFYIPPHVLTASQDLWSMVSREHRCSVYWVHDDRKTTRGLAVPEYQRAHNCNLSHNKSYISHKIALPASHAVTARSAIDSTVGVS